MSVGTGSDQTFLYIDPHYEHSLRNETHFSHGRPSAPMPTSHAPIASSTRNDCHPLIDLRKGFAWMTGTGIGAPYAIGTELPVPASTILDDNSASEADADEDHSFSAKPTLQGGVPTISMLSAPGETQLPDGPFTIAPKKYKLLAATVDSDGQSSSMILQHKQPAKMHGDERAFLHVERIRTDRATGSEADVTDGRSGVDTVRMWAANSARKLAAGTEVAEMIKMEEQQERQRLGEAYLLQMDA